MYVSLKSSGTYHNDNQRTIPKTNKRSGWMLLISRRGTADLVDISRRSFIFTIPGFQIPEGVLPIGRGRLLLVLNSRLLLGLVSDAEYLLGRCGPVPEVRLEFGSTFVQSQRVPERVYDRV
jgi:hypothetical protein